LKESHPKSGCNREFPRVLVSSEDTERFHSVAEVPSEFNDYRDFIVDPRSDLISPKMSPAMTSADFWFQVGPANCNRRQQ
jgi:hypothetical protein